jgi:hypothetical protein
MFLPSINYWYWSNWCTFNNWCPPMLAIIWWVFPLCQWPLPAMLGMDSTRFCRPVPIFQVLTGWWGWSLAWTSRCIRMAVVDIGADPWSSKAVWHSRPPQQLSWSQQKSDILSFPWSIVDYSGKKIILQESLPNSKFLSSDSEFSSALSQRQANTQ